MYATLLLVLVEFVCLTYGSGEHRICLSCPPVSHPRDCQSFVEVWPYERCSTDLFLLQNGSTLYEFGYIDATACTSSDGMEPRRVRRQAISYNDILLCHSCCTQNLCNRKLCGARETNDTSLACLSGEDVDGSSSPSASIAYCQEGEKCYAGIVHAHNNRPHPLTYVAYRCTSQVVCDRLQSEVPSVGSSGLCQKCCSQDGCNAHLCQSQVQESTTSAIDDTTQSSTTFIDCWDLQTQGGYTQSAEYDIYPAPTYSRLRVRCDMVTDGGGWTVLQKRFDGSVNFTRSFSEYEEGFGDDTGEHWVGLRWIHVLTTQQTVQMRVDLCTFSGQAGYAIYEGFNVSGPNDTYRFHTGVHMAGNLYNLLGIHDGEVFWASGSAADRYRGGWWYTSGSGFSANLNGGRYNGSNAQGIAWYDFGGSRSHPSLRSSEMKIRPLRAPGDPTQIYTCPILVYPILSD